MKIIINRRDRGIYDWDDDLLKYLIDKGWKWTTFSEDGKGIPKDKEAFIVLNYADCLITRDVNELSLESVLRTHPDFIEIIEKKLMPQYSHLSIIEIPDDIEYYIDGDEYGESVHEMHRIWN